MTYNKSSRDKTYLYESILIKIKEQQTYFMDNVE